MIFQTLYIEIHYSVLVTRCRNEIGCLPAGRANKLKVAMDVHCEQDLLRLLYMMKTFH